MPVRSMAFVLTLVLSTLKCTAQEGSRLGQFTELPAHRALMAQRTASELAEFTTDGCSGGMSDIWRTTSRQFPEMAKAYGATPPWEGCCTAHDRQYHNAGGTSLPEASYRARLRADLALKACVLKQGERDRQDQSQIYGVGEKTLKIAYTGIAEAMFLAVRLAGGPCSGLNWRWGYGFANCSVTPGVGRDISGGGKAAVK